MALVARSLAGRLKLPDDECDRIYLAGLLHDIGKIGISDAVLQKPDHLTPAEFDQIKGHPDQGWAILKDLDQLAHILPGVLHHHERYDGRGYPDRLAGDAIPAAARSSRPQEPSRSPPMRSSGPTSSRPARARST